MIGRTNAKGLSDKSWENYVAVRNRTKTTIEEGDIDVSSLTGINSAAYLFYGCSALTSAYLDFRNINGTGCLNYCFSNCTSLTTLFINIKNLYPLSSVVGIFASISTLKYIYILDIKNDSLYSLTSSNSNLFAQPQLASITTLNFSVPILPNLYLAVMTSLNLASVVQVLGQLFDYSTGAAHTITFNRSFTGLSQSDYDTIAAAVTTANARNWTVAGLTYSM